MDEKKVREAICCMKSFADDTVCEECDCYDRCDHTMVADNTKTAIEALEKQLPKKPTYEGDGYAPDGTFIWDEWLYPNCDSRYDVDYDDYSYCPNCGQRIDRDEEEEL